MTRVCAEDAQVRGAGECFPGPPDAWLRQSMEEAWAATCLCGENLLGLYLSGPVLTSWPPNASSPLSVAFLSLYVLLRPRKPLLLSVWSSSKCGLPPETLLWTLGPPLFSFLVNTASQQPSRCPFCNPGPQEQQRWSPTRAGAPDSSQSLRHPVPPAAPS